MGRMNSAPQLPDRFQSPEENEYLWKLFETCHKSKGKITKFRKLRIVDEVKIPSIG